MKPSLIFSPLGLIVITQIVVAVLIVTNKSGQSRKPDSKKQVTQADDDRET